MYSKMKDDLKSLLDSIRAEGLYKEERVISSRQGVEISLTSGKEVLNFCANNYLGLSGTQKLVDLAKEGAEKYGYGMSSVRFICGTQEIHKMLEDKISEFLEKDDTILYAACFDANGGVFEPLINDKDALISDKLNHASIIDGIRLCKAQRFVYEHSDMGMLEEHLKNTQNLRYRFIATDGVFSMDGDIAKLQQICDLADKYDAIVMVDDSHATGFMGRTGRGTIEHCGVMSRVDIVTSTLGKALGGAMGGFISGRKEIIELLRQRSRPYLFSNTLAPIIAYTSYGVFDMLSKTTELRDKLEKNTLYFRKKMTDAGFDIKEGVHPIVPIMLGKFKDDAKLSQDMARDLLEEGIYVTGFYYPVVPKGQSRIRVQISAAHETEHLDKAIDAFKKVAVRYGVIKQ